MNPHTAEFSPTFTNSLWSEPSLGQWFRSLWLTYQLLQLTGAARGHRRAHRPLTSRTNWIYNWAGRSHNLSLKHWAQLLNSFAFTRRAVWHMSLRAPYFRQKKQCTDLLLQGVKLGETRHDFLGIPAFGWTKYA